MNKRNHFIYNRKYELFFFSLLVVLFGSLFFPFEIYHKYIEPIVFLLNVLAGAEVVRRHKRLYWLCMGVFILSLGASLIEVFDSANIDKAFTPTVKLISYFFFYAVVTFELITQVWIAKKANAQALMALMSGYICLGLIGFFTFVAIEMLAPGSISGIESSARFSDDVMYFSFITLLTIGYGDMSPVTPIAQRASMFLGLIGQFYLVIIMAVVLDKFGDYRKKKKIEQEEQEQES